MKPLRLAPTLLLAGAMLAAHAASPDHVRAQFRVGLQAGYGTASGLDPGVGLGARAMFGLGLADSEGGETAIGAVTGMVSLNRFFPDCEIVDCGLWELNGNALLPLFAAQDFIPYLGAGIGISRLSVDGSVDTGSGPTLGLEDDTDIGLNLVGGVRYRGTRVTTFGELRKNVGSGDDPFYVTFGVLFGG